MAYAHSEIVRCITHLRLENIENQARMPVLCWRRIRDGHEKSCGSNSCTWQVLGRSVIRRPFELMIHSGRSYLVPNIQTQRGVTYRALTIFHGTAGLMYSVHSLMLARNQAVPWPLSVQHLLWRQDSTAMERLGLTTLWYLANGSQTEFPNSSSIWQTTTYNPAGFNYIHLAIMISFTIENFTVPPS